MPDDVRPSQPERCDQAGKILTVQVTGSVGSAFGADRIRVVIAPAVGNDAIVLGEHRNVIRPETIILEPAMDEHERIAPAGFNVREVSAVDPDALDRIAA